MSPADVRVRAAPAQDANEVENAEARQSARSRRASQSTREGISERFISALDARMAQSDLKERGWKGREDLDDLMRDLERLAAIDAPRALDLWSKYRPDDKDKPPFLDSDEYARDKRRNAAETDSPSKESAPEPAIPEQVRKRYIQADDKYYYRHDDNQLAFRDHGHKLVTPHDDPVVALSMVQIAQARGWQNITIRGSEEFRREAWLQASLKGMQVGGFRPRDVDSAKLEELRKELATIPTPSRRADRPSKASSTEKAQEGTPARNEVVDRTSVVDEPQRSLTPRQRIVLQTVKAVWEHQGATRQEIDIAAAATVERFQNQRVYVGEVQEWGEAPFENDPKNEKSFYVKLQTGQGDKTVWGVDLRRALQESSIRSGDDVVIANQGRQPVQVSVKDRDAQGRVIGTSTLTTNRNTWRVETLESLREEAIAQVRAKAAQADRAPLISIHDRDAERGTPRADVKVERARDQERAR